MGEPWESSVRVVLAIGIAAFLWSFSSSMEQIAKALTRLADAEEAKRGVGRSDEPSPAKPA